MQDCQGKRALEECFLKTRIPSAVCVCVHRKREHNLWVWVSVQSSPACQTASCKCRQRDRNTPRDKHTYNQPLTLRKPVWTLSAVPTICNNRGVSEVSPHSKIASKKQQWDAAPCNFPPGSIFLVITVTARIQDMQSKVYRTCYTLVPDREMVPA